MFQWYTLFAGIIWTTLRYTTKVKDTLNFRNKYGLKKQSSKESLWGPYYTPTLFAYSEELLQKPWDWPTWYNVVGFLFLREKEEINTHSMDPNLQNWLNEKINEPPVCITFSSMHINSKMMLKILKAAENRRVLLLYGNNTKMMNDLKLVDGKNTKLLAKNEDVVDDGDSNQLRNIYCVQRADHRIILPQCSCAVHHGGAGTAAATLKAGIPSLIVPQMLWCDQPGWAEVYRQRNVGVHCSKNSTVMEFIEGFKRCDLMKDECVRVGRLIRKGNGCRRAVDIMETCLCHSGDDYMKRHCLVHRRVKKMPVVASVIKKNN
jgi:sterol 3beta-glucosyltransferase